MYLGTLLVSTFISRRLLHYRKNYLLQQSFLCIISDGSCNERTILHEHHAKNILLHFNVKTDHG